MVVQVIGLPGDLVAGRREVSQTVPEQIVVVGLEIDLPAVNEKIPVLDQLPGMGQPVLVGRYWISCRGWVSRCLLEPAFLLQGLQKLM